MAAALDVESHEMVPPKHGLLLHALLPVRYGALDTSRLRICVLIANLSMLMRPCFEGILGWLSQNLLANFLEMHRELWNAQAILRIMCHS